MTVGAARTVRPATGPALRCRGWRQEGLLRMLENTVAIGERPADLVIYGGARPGGQELGLLRRDRGHAA